MTSHMGPATHHLMTKIFVLFSSRVVAVFISWMTFVVAFNLGKMTMKCKFPFDQNPYLMDLQTDLPNENCIHSKINVAQELP